jgi:hypothetical protein
MARELNFSLDNLKKVYVTSAKRGFLAVSDQPMCVTSSGCSGNDVILAVKHVCRENGRWVYCNPEIGGEWWLRKAWRDAIALTGPEPWRVYELDAAEIAARLDAGEFTDDVRGFRNRGEPWQPIEVDAAGDHTGFTTIANARVWERTDGWRVTAREDGLWTADESRCNADRSVLKYSPHHFDPLVAFEAEHRAEDAMRLVDANRPWK